MSCIVLQNKTATHCISVPLFVHFSVSPMKFFVTDFLAPIGAIIGAIVFKICVHLQVGNEYCVNERQDANPLFDFFPNFQFFFLSLL